MKDCPTCNDISDCLEECDFTEEEERNLRRIDRLRRNRGQLTATQKRIWGNRFVRSTPRARRCLRAILNDDFARAEQLIQRIERDIVDEQKPRIAVVWWLKDTLCPREPRSSATAWTPWPAGNVQVSADPLQTHDSLTPNLPHPPPTNRTP